MNGSTFSQTVLPLIASLMWQLGTDLENVYQKEINMHDLVRNVLDFS
jgi:hypothetical protein